MLQQSGAVPTPSRALCIVCVPCSPIAALGKLAYFSQKQPEIAMYSLDCLEKLPVKNGAFAGCGGTHL